MKYIISNFNLNYYKYLYINNLWIKEKKTIIMIFMEMMIL